MTFISNMDTSIFTDKEKAPDEKELANALGKSYDWLSELKALITEHVPDAKEEWNYSKMGWNYRIKDKKRAIMYVMPYDKYFKASFVFGAKATEQALADNISPSIKDIITTAKVYAEGRGFRVDVTSKKIAADVKRLVAIKLAN